jgi:hypothetical protein
MEPDHSGIIYNFVKDGTDVRLDPATVISAINTIQKLFPQLEIDGVAAANLGLYVGYHTLKVLAEANDGDRRSPFFWKLFRSLHTLPSDSDSSTVATPPES